MTWAFSATPVSISPGANPEAGQNVLRKYGHARSREGSKPRVHGLGTAAP